MDIRAYLAEQGLSNEEVDAIVGNDKAAKAMNAALSRYEEGTTALSRAQAEKDETAQFWQTKTQELEGSVQRLTAAEKRAAQAEAAAAQRTAYLKSLAEQGYDVPKEYYEGSAKPANPNPENPGNGNYLTRDDFDKGRRATGADLVSLTKLSNEYSYLYGKPYLSVDEDFAEAQRQGKPLTEYARSKYGFDAKRRELDTAAEQKRIDELVSEKMKTREAELVAKYGSNPETRSPLPSKFDKLQKQEGFKSDSWKSPQGRRANREERLKKFENISIQ